MIYYEKVYKYGGVWLRQCAGCWDVCIRGEQNWFRTELYEKAAPYGAVLVARHVVFK